MVENLISLNDAAQAGITTVRKREWVSPESHLKIDIVDGKVGLWLHLYNPMNERLNGRNPVDVLSIWYNCTRKEWVEHKRVA